MEIVCLLDRERDDSGKGYWTYINLLLCQTLHFLYFPTSPPVSPPSMLTSAFYRTYIDCDTNMEIVLPANYSIVASCALNLRDFQLSQQTQVAPHNRMDIKFYYHIGNTCRQHRI